MRLLGAQTVEYLKLKQELTELEKKVQDWERKVSCGPWDKRRMACLTNSVMPRALLVIFAVLVAAAYALRLISPCLLYCTQVDIAEMDARRTKKLARSAVSARHSEVSLVGGRSASRLAGSLDRPC